MIAALAAQTGCHNSDKLRTVADAGNADPEGVCNQIAQCGGQEETCEATFADCASAEPCALWDYDLSCDLWKPTFDCEGNVYLTERYCSQLHALTRCGEVRWVFDFGLGDLPMAAAGSPVVLPNGGIVVATYAAEGPESPPDSMVFPLLAFDTEGAELWSFSMGAGVEYAAYTTPVVGVAGNLYVVMGGVLVSLTPDGERRWLRSPLDPEHRLQGHMAVSPQGVIYVTGHMALFAYNSDGNKLWMHDSSADNWIINTIALDHSDRVLIGLGNPTGWSGGSIGVIRSLHPSGEMAWQITVADTLVAELLVRDDGVVAYRANKEIGAISRDGTLLWEQQLEMRPVQLQLVEQGLLILDNSNMARVVDLADGATLSTSSLSQPASPPAIVGDNLLLLDRAGYVGLAAIGVPWRPTRGGWPISGGNARNQGRICR